MHFYVCHECNHIVISKREEELFCCQSKMEEIHANTVDAAQEKHVPIFKKEEDYLVVSVGEVMHPMTPEHFIEWILVEYENGYQIQYLTPDMEPVARFISTHAKSVYAYCNLHGLWKIEIH